MPIGALGALGMQAANTALGTIFGLSLEKHEDQRQLNQQSKLNDMQLGAQQQLTAYNMQKQLELWKATNYKAQMSELAKAGLNPGLIYGMSGGGGATTSLAQGTLSAPQAPHGSGTAMAMAGMGLQSALQAAQIENIKAQTEKTKAEIPKTLAETESITEGVKNMKTQGSILKWEDNLKRIESNIAEQTQGDRMGQIVELAESAALAKELLAIDKEIADETKAAKIAQIQADSANAILGGKKITAEIAQGWTKLNIEQQQLEINKLVAEYQTTHPGVGQVTGSILEDLRKALKSIMKNPVGPNK